MEWCPAGWSVFLPLLIFPCTVKSRSSLLALAHWGGPGKRVVKRLWCVCVWFFISRHCVTACALWVRFISSRTPVSSPTPVQSAVVFTSPRVDSPLTSVPTRRRNTTGDDASHQSLPATLSPSQCTVGNYFIIRFMAVVFNIS